MTKINYCTGESCPEGTIKLIQAVFIFTLVEKYKDKMSMYY